MIKRVTKRFDNFKDAFEVFYFALIAAGLLHVCFLLIFFYLGIQALAVLNVFSCVVYYFSIRFFIKVNDSVGAKDFRLLAFLNIVEVIAHAYIVSVYIGLDSGFHYYILMLTVIPMINGGVAFYTNIIRLVLIMIAYSALLIWLNNALPIYQLSPTILGIMRIFNASVLIFGVGVILLKVLTVLLKEKQMLSDLAVTDKLTGLFNRHGFMKFVAQEFGDDESRIDALSILVLDVDYFKEVNDQYGHQCGDYVLSKLAGLMREVLRKHEMIARWGGDEFIVLLPDTDESELATLAERLREEVAQTTFTYLNHQLSISVTIGGTTYQPGDSFELLTSRADRALYEGKNAGRNAFNMLLA